MEKEPEQMLSRQHQLVAGYIVYSDIKLAGLPESIHLGGEKLLKKNEFHITIINTEEIAKLIDPGNSQRTKTEIITQCQGFIEKNKLNKFKLLDQFRAVQKDVRKTIVVMCEFPDGEEFFAHLNKKYKKSLPIQPFHVTLYSLDPDVGIGIASNDQLDEISRAVIIPELANIKPA
ncbi:MAG: hypothetical protein WDZ34_02650 [Candidatus Saccharimonadales bacterium]